jgi:hypothetical protein
MPYKNKSDLYQNQIQRWIKRKMTTKMRKPTPKPDAIIASVSMKSSQGMFGTVFSPILQLEFQNLEDLTAFQDN